MNEDKTRFMEFKALGSNCVDCGFSLSGRMNTIGSDICSKIEQEFRGGTLCIDIQDDVIKFLFEGITVGFEPYRDANSDGFVLMAAD